MAMTMTKSTKTSSQRQQRAVSSLSCMLRNVFLVAVAVAIVYHCDVSSSSLVTTVEAFTTTTNTVSSFKTTTTITTTALPILKRKPAAAAAAVTTITKSTHSLSAAAVIAAAVLTSSIAPANAYVPSDYATDTVQKAIEELKQSQGNVDATFKAYENIAGIITEGKGVGGMVNYKGISLDRGYVADEDTSIYNPGLTLLTESEKERLVEAVIDARKAGLASNNNQWSENNEYAFDFLREKLDPLHLVELSGFLKIMPFYAGVLYLGVLAVQQVARESFQIAYLAGVALFFLPILALIAAGV